MKDKQKLKSIAIQNRDRVDGDISQKNTTLSLQNLPKNENIQISKEKKLMVDVRDVATIEIEMALQCLKKIHEREGTKKLQSLCKSEDKYRYSDRFIVSSTEKRITSEQIELYLTKEYNLDFPQGREKVLSVNKET